MEMVDMGITRFGVWGRKSRSVHNFSQRSDLGLLGLILGLLKLQGELVKPSEQKL